MAYTSLALTGHTDNPYRRAAPEVQLLHAIVNEAEGGESTLTDGFMLAEILRAESPELLAALAETEVLFRFVDERSDLAHAGRIVELDARGRPAQIRFSGRVDYARPMERSGWTRFIVRGVGLRSWRSRRAAGVISGWSRGCF